MSPARTGDNPLLARPCLPLIPELLTGCQYFLKARAPTYLCEQIVLLLHPLIYPCRHCRGFRVIACAEYTYSSVLSVPVRPPQLLNPGHEGGMMC